ncbi:MAG TPA: permease [Clostridia bacterium]|nr:permease [Clostridia bacterium]
MDIFTLVLWVITLIWFFFSIFKDKKKTMHSVKMSTGMMKSIGGDIVAILLMIGLILTLIPPESLEAFLVKNDTFFATVVFALIGSITLIPAFVAFPLAGSLTGAGAGIMPIVAFITTLTMVGVVTFPLEKKEFGTKFVILRNSLSFVFAIVIAVAMGVLL